MSDFKPVNQPVTPTSAEPGEEFPFLHTITVVDRVVSVDKPELVQNNIKTETVTLNLDSEWDGLSCIINIGNGDTPTSLIWSGQPVTIPAELMTDIGALNVSVVGYGDDGALRAVTKKADAMFTVVASGYVEGDEPVPDPTTILGQLTEAADRANQAAQNADDSTIDKVDVTMLPTGSEASGSVADKTLSLSIPQGPQGPKGDPGDLTTVAHDTTLTGDGTSGNPLGVNTSISPILSGTDLRTLFTKAGTYLKNWGTLVSGGPTSIHNSATSKYIVKVYSDSSDSYIRIDPMASVGDIYYAMKNPGGLFGWYKVSAVKQQLGAKMLDTFQTIINAGGYDLTDLTERIKTLYALGELTEDEMTQLLESAQTNAKPDDSYAPLADRVKAIEEWETTIEERLAKLESGSSTDPGEPEETADEWPEYKQPTGAHDAYHVGDKITYNGKHYTCTYNGCVWTPDEYPQGWQLVE